MTDTLTGIQPSGTMRIAKVSTYWRANVPWTAGFIVLHLLANSPQAHTQQGRSTCTQARPYLTAAQTALTASDSATALKKLSQAVESDPKCPDAHLLLGLTEFQHGEVAKSIEHYHEALKLDPGSYSAHYDLALAYLKEKKLQLARAELEQAVALNPKEANAAYDLGIVLLETGQPAAALRSLRRPDVSFNLVRAGLAAGRLEEARQAAQQAPSQLISDFQWNAAIGQEFLKHAQPKDALPYLRTANLIRPVDEGVRNQLAAAYLASRQPESVLELIKEPKTADEHYLCGSAFYQAHRFTDADEESDAALALAPENPRVLALRVRILQRAGQQQAALEMTRKASRLAPKWDEPFYLAGISYYFLRNYTEARRSLARAFELNAAIALQPDNARFHCHLGILLMRENEYTKAEESLKKAAQLKPEYALPHYELGKLWVYSKQWKDARQEFESTIAVDPGFTSAYYHLARVYARLGEGEKSESMLADFKRLHRQETDDSAAVEEDATREADSQ